MKFLSSILFSLLFISALVLSSCSSETCYTCTGKDTSGADLSAEACVDGDDDAADTTAATNALLDLMAQSDSLDILTINCSENED